MKLEASGEVESVFMCPVPVPCSCHSCSCSLFCSVSVAATSILVFLAAYIVRVYVYAIYITPFKFDIMLYFWYTVVFFCIDNNA